jgi:hypothetical protein
MPDATNTPLLRTLAPALRELERRLRDWLAARRRFPLTTLQRATLEGLAGDLGRQAEALAQDQPLLVIVLMGGTGVGKSTLMNALAGGAVAQASLARPTTRDPVVYYHQSVNPARLDPALQYCKLVAHDRPGLEQKIIVDTPDLDSNDLSNREKLLRILPVADVVLYVGSQEKYHDQLGWELFRAQRQRRAFAFVLNKWDRCFYPGAGGIRPDEDLRRSLRGEGFEHPLLFRTCAQYWVDHPWQNNGATGPPVEGEQFLDLVRWLEAGLSRLEIEAIKARGVSQLLHQLENALEAARPPDLTTAADRTRLAWNRAIDEEAGSAASVLLNTLQPYAKEIEHHFAHERQRHFHGVMALYLQGINRLRYAGSTLRDHIPLAPRSNSPVETPREWDLATFTRACSAAAAEQHLDARMKALANRLLVEADQHGMPLALLTEPTEALARLDWKGRHAQSMIEILTQVEQSWSRPAGPRWWLQRGVVFLADWLPLLTEPTEALARLDWKGRHAQAMIEILTQVEQSWSRPAGPRWWLQRGVVFLADWLPVLSVGVTGTMLIWDYTMSDPRRPLLLSDLLIPLVVLLFTLIVLHVLILVAFPLNWLAIRREFEDKLRRRLLAELEQTFDSLPLDAAREVLSERRGVEQFLNEIREVTSWLEQREQAANVDALYGRAPLAG